jgi:hypothetical protein
MVVVVALSVCPISALEPRRPGQESSLIRAVFADGRLWLLSDAGELSSIAEGASVRANEPLDDPALDLCLRQGHPAVVTCGRKDCSNWTLRQRIAGQWSSDGTVPTQGDDLLALNCATDESTLLTTRRLIDVRKGSQAVVTLSDSLPAEKVVSVLVTADQAFVGINAGEWGGGLRRIDRRTGKVTMIESNATGELCGGPLNSQCDPVNGIAVEPWRADCIAVAVGLVHFEPHGRIVEVCGDSVRELYSAPYVERSSSGAREKSTDSFQGTVAFFGLTLASDALWAAGLDGVYRLDANGAARTTALPKFQVIGGIGVSFKLPRLVLVLTSVNQRHSVSGNVPILVAR